MSDQAQELRDLVDQQSIAGRRETSRIVAVFGGKGGVGKTSFAVNAGITWARRGLRVVLVDADVTVCNVGLLLDVMPRYRLGDVLCGRCPPAEALVDGPGDIRVLAGGSSCGTNAHLSALGFRRIIEKLDPWDVLLIDPGRDTDRRLSVLAPTVTDLVVLTTPELASIMGAYEVLKVWADGGPRAPGQMVVNMAGNPWEAEHVYRMLSSAVQRFLRTPLAHLGHVPRDRAVIAGLEEQTPFILRCPDSPAARAVAAMARRLIGDGKDPEPQPADGFETDDVLDKLLRLFHIRP